MNKVCVVTGVGPGTGLATVKRFCAEYQVAMIARSENFLQQVDEENQNAHAFTCDMRDLEGVERTIEDVRTRLGEPTVLIHNAVRGGFGTYDQIDVTSLEKSFRVNVSSLLHLAKLLAPDMIEAGRGSIVCTGNTAAYRGVPNFTSFAPTKAAQRILCESLARTLGPKGIHVGYVAIDAVIDLPWTRRANPDREDSYFAKPADIAEQIWHLVHQPKSTWSFDVVIRPYGENW